MKRATGITNAWASRIHIICNHPLPCSSPTRVPYGKIVANNKRCKKQPRRTTQAEVALLGTAEDQKRASEVRNGSEPSVKNRTCTGAIECLTSYHSQSGFLAAFVRLSVPSHPCAAVQRRAPSHFRHTKPHRGQGRRRRGRRGGLADGGRRARWRPRLIAFKLVERTSEVPYDGARDSMSEVRQKRKQHGNARILGGSPVGELHPCFLRLHHDVHFIVWALQVEYKYREQLLIERETHLCRGKVLLTTIQAHIFS